MIDARGNLVEVTEETEPDLLYAIRGAGQFFGLITELTIKATPLAELGNNQGVIWAGAFIFPLERAKEVALVMEKLMDDANYATAGLMMIQAPPPARNPAIVIAARYTGNPDDAERAYKPLYDLKPLVARGGAVPIQNTSDGRDAIGFKSAMSLHDIRYWQNNLIWHTDPANRQKVDDFNDQSIAIMRGPDRSEYADFQNGTRTGPIELRYRGVGKLEKLRVLKKKWDPTGVFTKQLLE
ncbi:hypothetical protein F4806DRAFT_194633 [Annulohypoxylon nitens]|nr:hypothetical protein F4806DRAFT_194633 [Annulohypoxylon nitens]